MKTKLYILIIISLFSIYTSCYSQNKELLLKKIDSTIHKIEGFLKFSKISIGVSLDSVDEKPFDSENKNNFKTKKDYSDTAINTIIDSLKITQKLILPYNLIELEFQESDFAALIGLDLFYFHNNSDELPFFELEKITFSDGTTINAKNNFLSADDVKKKYYNGEKLNEAEEILEDIHTPFRKHFLIKDKRPIKNIQFKFTRFKKNRQTHTLKKTSEKIETKYGNIYLERIAKNTLSFRIPTILNKSIQVNALYEDGRLLRSTGGGSRTDMTDEEKHFYKEFLEVLKKATREVSTEKISTEKELKKYLKKQSPKLKKGIDYTLRNFKFKGPVHSVEITILDTKSSRSIHNVVYSFSNRH